MKKIILVLLSLFMFSTNHVYALSLEQYQIDLLENHSDFFEYVDEITLDVSLADGIILEPMTEKVLLDVKHNIIDRKSENDKSAELFKNSLPYMVETMEELNDELDNLYEDFENTIYDLYTIFNHIQKGETEYDLETLANR